MDLFVEGLVRAITLLVQGDPELLRVAWLSLQVSGTATVLCLVIGVPLGTGVPPRCTTTVTTGVAPTAIVNRWASPMMTVGGFDAIAPSRAPSRAAFAMLVYSIMSRPISKMPSNTNKKIGATRANSTMA